MKRKCIIYKSSERFNRHIAIDFEEAKEIIDFLEDVKCNKKFEYISDRILEQASMYYDDYEQIESNITCMRFFPNGINARIYCQEVTIHGEIFCIVMSKYLLKKSNSINKFIQSKIDALKSYEYEIEYC
ncbi:hypothetical protein [Mucilaginibacter arboris]|uniref:Addiction module toxin RelE n=1 Tax=Mucilaginibacter arboris TaxID=2682090 RepID=A0A7K1SVL3_9SPHI|nr:hypothetical protein [Mucilaginibacter arboris]MVN21090.1 hypothetical protein [Mucilaginibacter arboris]